MLPHHIQKALLLSILSVGSAIGAVSLLHGGSAAQFWRLLTPTGAIIVVASLTTLVAMETRPITITWVGKDEELKPQVSRLVVALADLGYFGECLPIANIFIFRRTGMLAMGSHVQVIVGPTVLSARGPKRDMLRLKAIIAEPSTPQGS